MKNILSLFLISLLSATLAIFIYRFIDPPKEIIIQEVSSLPTAMMVNNLSQSDQLFSDIPERRYISSAPTDFIAAASAVTSSVVNIKTTQGSSIDFWGNSFSSSSGSGVVISSDGYIVTNNHVIEDGDTYEITLNDKKEYKAKLIGTDPSTDLALLKINENDLPHLGFGNSDSLMVGEWVLAVGNPFNLESTVTAGIVSAKGRNINILEDNYSIESFIQTDAAVNPGNSGGALVNTNGELIGINTAIITRSGRYEGYSFAIPTNLAKKIIRDLKDFGVVQRGILGVRISEMTSQLAKELGLKEIEGVHLTSVTSGSGADDAGLQKGDVIISINGVKTKTLPVLQEQVARYRPGNVLKVEYIRSEKIYRTDVVLKNQKNTTELVNIRNDKILETVGFELRELTESEKRNLKTKGVYVISIYKGSKIERTNMDPNFIITKINDDEVESVDEAIRLLSDASGKVMVEGVYKDYTGQYLYTFRK